MSIETKTVRLSFVAAVSLLVYPELHRTNPKDALAISAVDEENPVPHPDTLRRRRTLRDAGLAAKATPSASGSLRSVPGGGGSSSNRSLGGSSRSGGGMLGREVLRSLSGSSFSRSGRISGTAIAPGDEAEVEDDELEIGAPSRQKSGQSLARVALGTSRWVGREKMGLWPSLTMHVVVCVCV